MKKLYLISTFLLLTISIMSFSSLNAQTATNTIGNFQINGTQTKFSFDIFTLRTSSPAYNMGNSTYGFSYNSLALANPVLTFFNTKYKTGSPTGDYGNPGVVALPFPISLLLVQIFYTGSGSGTGDAVADGPLPGEKIATVEMDITNPNDSAKLFWDPLSSEIVTPTLLPIIVSTYVGSYNGLLPVELSSFTSTTTRNNVTLHWSTASEINNMGFEIERRNVGSSSEWAKVGFVNGYGNSNEVRSYSFTNFALSVGRYNYRLKQIDFNGNFEYFELQNEVVVGVPTTYELSQNYPNPFNPTTKINFALPNDGKVNLSIYDISGRLVSILINNEVRTADYYTVEFNGSNFSSGTYFYSLQSDNFKETKKMLLIK